jgi:hypothetical protein
MTKPPRQPDPSGFRPEDQFDDVFAYGNPNPDRVGCPSREVLRALSRRERPIDDPGYEHISNCSPCFREFRALQQARAAELRSRRRFWAFVSAAAVLVIVSAGAAWLLTAPGGKAGRRDDAVRVTQVAEHQTILDLQKYTVNRGEQTATGLSPLTLAAARHELTVLLPVGAEPGTYEVQVVDLQQRSRAAASGDAQIRDYVTTLKTRLDASSVPPGEYRLALRRRGDDWHYYPVVIQ